MNSTSSIYNDPNRLRQEVERLFSSSSFFALFSTVLSAVARLDARARYSPRRKTWMQRVLFGEACACQLAEGDLVHLEDLVLLDGYAFSGGPSIGLSSALQVLNAWRGASRANPDRALGAPRPGLVHSEPIVDPYPLAAEELAPECSAPDIETWRRVQREAQRLPPLLAAVIAWDSWLALLPESRAAWRATLLAALTLKARGLTSNLLLPIDIGWRFSKYRRHADHDFATRIRGFLTWAETAAIQAYKEFDSIELAEEQFRASLRSRRSSSRMPAMVELLLERPFVSVPLAAKALRISRQAAHVLLTRIGAPAHKLTDRKRYNAWTIIG